METLIEKLKRQIENFRANEYACCAICWSYEEAEAILSALELVEWLDQECPEGTQETFDLSHDFTEKLRHRIENIKSK